MSNNDEGLKYLASTTIEFPSGTRVEITGQEGFVSRQNALISQLIVSSENLNNNTDINNSSNDDVGCVRISDEELESVKEEMASSTITVEDTTEPTIEESTTEHLYTLNKRISTDITIQQIKDAEIDNHLCSLMHNGDEILIPLKDGNSIIMEVASVHLNWARLVLKYCYGVHNMYSVPQNNVGYFHSSLRSYLLNYVFNKIPDDWKEIIVPRKLQDIREGGSFSEFKDPIWVPSVGDIFGVNHLPSREYIVEEDSVQLPIFKSELGRVKELPPESPSYTGTCSYWTRTPDFGTNDSFYIVHSVGCVHQNAASEKNGVVFGMDI